MDRKRVNEVGESIAIRVNEVTRLVSLGIESTKGGDELANQEQKPSELLYLDQFLAIFQPFLRWLLTIGFLESTFHAQRRKEEMRLLTDVLRFSNS